LKVLMSAFSCGPGRGSEPGVGWNMAVEVARLGHEVVVLTQTEFAVEIEQQLASDTLPPGLRFDIYMPPWLARLRDFGFRCKQPALTWHLTSVLWQFCALLHVRRRYRDAGFDLIHHVTFASIRHPTLLPFLNVPTVLGPLGGGDIIPIALRKSFPWKYWLVELFRDLHNRSLRADPMTRAAFRRARIIFLRTDASMAAVPPRDRGKVCVSVGLGVADLATDLATAEPTPRKPNEPLRLLYAGGLIYLKGIPLGLRALAHARAQGADAILTIVGDGPAREDFERLTVQLGLKPQVSFRGHVTRDQLLRMYRQHHVMLFPSLRDAGGMVVLEAWGQALPVICFGLGGPGQMVDETCGRVVAVTNRGESECATALGDEILALAADDQMRLSLGRAALARHQRFSWRQIASSLYGEIEARLQRRASDGPDAMHPDFQQGFASKPRPMRAAQGAAHE
jgi:glycosyltransferase involved in cell wall biosynthesis